MADVTKTVEIALKVVGMDGKKISDIAKGFESIQKAVDKANTSVKGLQTSLNNLKTPASLTKVMTELKAFNSIKIPNLNNIALGFEKLGNIKEPANLKPFAESLKDLANIKVPGINALATGLQKLADPKLLNLSGFAMRIGTVEKGLKRLEAINLKTLESVLSKIAKIDLNKAANSVKNLEKGVRDTGVAADKAGLKIRSFGDKVTTVFQFRLISAALLSLQAALSSGISAIVEYDQALKDLQAITGATTLEVSQMGTMILEVASTTKFSASEVAEGMRVIGQAGFSASEAVETMQAVSDLATGTLSSMATTVDLVTTAMRVFQIDASESATVADVFANAVNKSKLTIDKLRTSMNYIGPIAQASGVSFTELSAAMGTLANSGLRASTIGTGLRRVFAELIDPSKKLKEAANNAGVALAELDPRSAGLSEVIANLGLVLDDAQVAFDVFGKRGAAAALALSDTDSGFQKMLITVGESGTAARMAAIQMEGLGVSFKNLKDKLGILAIAIGNAGLSGIMRVLIDLARKLIDVLTYLTNTTFGNLIIQATLLTAALFAISQTLTLIAGTKAFIALIAGIKGALVWIAVAGTSVSALLLAFAPWALVIAGATAALIKFLSHLKKTKEASADAAKLSDTYSGLAKKVQDYNVKIAALSEDSYEFLNANKALRADLLETAKKLSGVSVEARAAALSINPLTGEIVEGSEALKIYNERVQELALEKLAESARLANKSFKDESRFFSKDVKDYDEFAGVLKDTVLTYDQLKEAAARVGDSGDDLTKRQKKLLESFSSITELSGKAFDKMQLLGQVNVDDTVENFTELAKEIVGTGVVLEGVVSQFKDLQKANESSFSNIIEKWAVNGKDGVADFIDEYKKLGGVFAEGDEAQIRSSELSREFFVKQLQRYKEEKAAAEKAGIDKNITRKAYYEAERKLLEAAGELRKKTSENISAQNIKLIILERATLEKELKKLAVVYAKNDELRYKLQEEAKRESLKREQDLVIGTITDPKILLTAYKSELQERETLFAKHLDGIALQEAKGLLNTEQAADKKLQATIDFHKKSYNEAVKHQNAVEKLDDPEAFEKAKKETLKKEAAYYKVRTKLAIEYNNDIKEANDKIADLDSKVTDEIKKNTNKRVENKKDAADKLEALEVAYADKVESINEALAKKLKDIDAEVVENRKQAKSDMLSLEQSTEEKIRNVRKKGMTDEQQDASDLAAAQNYLNRGIALVAQASAEKDKEKLARGTDLIKQSESLATGLNNERAAINILQKSLSGLKNARNTKAELKELDLLKKKNEEVAEAAEKQAALKEGYELKVKNATSAITKIEMREDVRHNKAMANLQKEINKWQELLRIASERVDAVVQDDPAAKSDVSPVSTQKTEAEIELLKEKAELEKQTIEIAQNGYRVIEQDGVKMYTNLDDAARKSMDNFAMIEEKGVKAFTQIAKEGKEKLSSITSGVDSDGVRWWSELGNLGTKAMDKLKVKADESAKAFSGIGEVGVEAIDEIIIKTNDSADSFKGIGDEGLKSLNLLKDAIEVTKDETDDLEVESELVIEVDDTEVKETQSLFEILNDFTKTALDLLVKVIGFDDVKALQKSFDELRESAKKPIIFETKFISTGTAPPTYTGFATGGKLPGYGGGDRNPVLAEDGEWFIRKEAVRKYGDGFMSMINSMSLPKFEFGGSVGGSSVKSTANPLANFGKVQLDNGNTSIPALISKETFSDLSTQLSNAKRFAV